MNNLIGGQNKDFFSLNIRRVHKNNQGEIRKGFPRLDCQNFNHSIEGHKKLLRYFQIIMCDQQVSEYPRRSSMADCTITQGSKGGLDFQQTPFQKVFHPS